MEELAGSPQRHLLARSIRQKNQFYFIVITSSIATQFSRSMFPFVATKALDIKEGTQFRAIAFYTR